MQITILHDDFHAGGRDDHKDKDTRAWSFARREEEEEMVTMSTKPVD